MGMMMNEDVIFYQVINTDLPKSAIHIETFLTQIFALASVTLQKRYSEYLFRVIPSQDTEYKTAEEIDKETLGILKVLMESFTQLKSGTPEELGEIKYHFDSLFFSLTKKGQLEYLYSEDYLLTVDEAGALLNVSRTSINKYAKNGQLEMLDTTKHKKVPQHAVKIWGNPELHTLVQMLHIKYLERDSFTKYKGIMERVREYESAYENQTFHVVYKDVLDGKKHWDEVDCSSDFLEWEALEEDRTELEKKLGIKG